MAEATLVLRNIGELVTCDAERGPAPGVVRHAALAAHGAAIAWLGEEAALPPGLVGPATVTVDAGGAAVMPGFVDAHTHAVWLGHRGDEFARRSAGESYEAIAAAGGGIRATVRATGAGTPTELAAAARPRLAAMRAAGTTTVEVKSGYAADLDGEVRMLEVARDLGEDPTLPEVVTTFLPLHAAPGGDRRAWLDEAAATGTRVARAAGARFADAFCEQGAYTPAECEAFLTAAARAGLRPKLHADQRSAGQGAQLAARVGAVSADHLEHVDDAGIAALAAAGVVAVLLPGAALVLDGPRPPGRRLLEGGVRVAVATDCNPGTCWSESMPLVTALAVGLAGLTPAEAVVAATSGGAAALGLDDRGTLRAGMRCDLAVLSTRHWVDVAYHLGGDVVAATVRGGRLRSTATLG